MTIALREDYQVPLLNDLRQALRTHRRICAVLATGGGKSAILSALAARAAAKGNRVWILAHRRKLVAQLSATVSRWGVEHGVIQAGAATTAHSVQVASVGTVVRRLDAHEPPDVIIVDEGHHLTLENQWGRIVAAYPDAYLIGFTATPQRLDGKGLGEGHGGYYQRLVIGPTAQWLTDHAYLAQAITYSWPAPDPNALKVRAGDYTAESGTAMMMKRAVMGDVINHYRRYLDGKTAIANCCSVKHAKAVAECFNAAGIAAAAITGHTSKDEQDRLYAELATGELKILCQCELISEGVDIPSVNGALMLRPTQSVVVWLQQCGRVLRPKPDGSKAVILDFVGNARRLGLPTDPRPWTLEGKQKRASDAPPVRVCVRCYAANPGGVSHCQECGHEFPVQSREDLQQIDGELQEISGHPWKAGDKALWRGDVWYVTAKPINGRAVIADRRSGQNAVRNVVPVNELTPTTRRPRHPAAGCRTLQELLAAEKQRGYRKGWAHHIYASRQHR